MTDKIVLTKKQFERWFERISSGDNWGELVAESQKPELIERWCLFTKAGSYYGSYRLKEHAEEEAETERALKYGPFRIVLLREVEGG